MYNNKINVTKNIIPLKLNESRPQKKKNIDDIEHNVLQLLEETVLWMK